MKKFLCLLTALLLVFSLPMTVMAETELSRVVDDADLLSETEEDTLKVKIDSITQKYNCDVVAVTVEDFEGKTAQEYADDYYDDYGYGVGIGDDGILFVYSIDDNEAAISTYGYGIDAFTDYGIDYIFDEVTPYVRNKDYYQVMYTYVNLSEKFLKEARNNRPYDTNNKVKGTIDYIKYEAIALGVSLVLAIIIVVAMKLKMNTALKRSTAQEYIRAGSMNLTVNKDVFMYSNTTKVKIQSSSSSGGGSSTHRSSSGRSHGGGSRKF